MNVKIKMILTDDNHTEECKEIQVEIQEYIHKRKRGNNPSVLAWRNVRFVGFGFHIDKLVDSQYNIPAKRLHVDTYLVCQPLNYGQVSTTAGKAGANAIWTEYVWM